MPKLVSSRIIAASHYPYEPPEALKKYLSTGGTIQALTRRIMARPMIETAEMLQAEFEEGMDAHSYTPPGKPVVPRDWGYTKMGGFLHPSYSRDVLIPSKACFHRVVKCAGILDSPAWLAKRPLPTEMTTAEAHELRLYYKQVIDEFEELMEDELSWVKELNPEWIAAIEARVTGPSEYSLVVVNPWYADNILQSLPKRSSRIPKKGSKRL